MTLPPHCCFGGIQKDKHWEQISSRDKQIEELEHQVDDLKRKVTLLEDDLDGAETRNEELTRCVCVCGVHVCACVCMQMCMHA